jgi:hypothetical protein
VNAPAVLGVVVLAVAWVALLVVLLAGLCRAAKAGGRVDEEAADPINAVTEQLVDDLEALVNATRCDCPRCTARRRRVTP